MAAAVADFGTVCERELASLLDFVGTDQHLYICGVNKAMQSHYHKPKDKNTEIVLCKTSYKAVFESVSRLNLAVQHGLQLDGLSYEAGRYASIEVLQAAQTQGLKFPEHLAHTPAASSSARETVSDDADDGDADDGDADDNYDDDDDDDDDRAFDDMIQHYAAWRISAENVLNGAARSGSVPKLQWLMRQRQGEGHLHSDIVEEAAKGGSVEVMQWLRTEGRVHISAQAVHTAALHNHLRLVKYLRNTGTEFHPDTVVQVALAGHLEMLKWLIEQGSPMILVTDTIGMARLTHFVAISGNVDMLKWLTAEHGVNVADAELNAFSGAAVGGSITAMDWLIRQGCVSSVDASARPVEHGVKANSTAALEWLRQHGHLILSPALYESIFHATRNASGHLKVLKWLREVAQCPCDAAELARHVAAGQGHLDCFQYLQQQGVHFTTSQLMTLLRLTVSRNLAT